MAKILFVTTELPFPARSGGTIKSFRLIEFLSQRHDLSVFSLVDELAEDREEAFLKEIKLEAYASFPLKKKRNLMNLLRSYTKRIPLNQYRNYHSKAAEIIAAMAQNQDMVIVDHYEMGVYLEVLDGAKIIYHAHNAEFKLWERLASLERDPLKRRAISLETQRVISAEKHLMNKSHKNFMALSDREKFKELGIEVPNYKETKHLGTDSWLNLPDIEFSQTEKCLFYMGSLSWPANSDGLVWFFREIWPLVLQEEPNMGFKLLGKGMKRALKKEIKRWTQVELLGYVDAPSAIMEKCRLGVVPLRYGSGMKIKVLDNLYRGLPMVTTPIGAEGIAIKDGKEASIKEHPKDFADCVLRLVREEKRWTAYRDASRKLAESKYLWDQELLHFEKTLFD